MDKNIDKAIDKLEEIRVRRGKTKAEFAENFDVSVTSYSNWVHGRKEPSDINKHKIDVFIANAEVERIDAEFRDTEEILIKKLVWLTLPEETWEKLEDKGYKDLKKLMEKIEDFLKELAEREKTEA